VRWLGGLVLVVAVASTASAKPSNPAFLGIGMHDAGGGAPGGLAALGPCQVDTITRGSGAMAAGLQSGDLLVAIDAVKLVNCDAVLKAVQGHDANDTIKIDVLRGSRVLSLSAQLLSRDEILRRRLVGQLIPSTELVSVDDPTASIDLSNQRGKTTIVGWYSAGSCSGCSTVLGKLATWARKQSAKGGTPIQPIAVTIGDRDNTKVFRGSSLEVPLVLADVGTFEDLAIRENERITFMVIDCRGVVQHIAPVLPESDDADAMLDGLFAAAEQAARRQVK